ncbi:hypothetical protein phiOC_p226 [Ochrobactrum phage vB_OspM_OC]|nr:hypothetical protein phiOC_p226 [Ochrobactrum phage vB_OspM_OC]
MTSDNWFELFPLSDTIAKVLSEPEFLNSDYCDVLVCRSMAGNDFVTYSDQMRIDHYNMTNSNDYVFNDVDLDDFKVGNPGVLFYYPPTEMKFFLPFNWFNPFYEVPKGDTTRIDSDGTQGMKYTFRSKISQDVRKKSIPIRYFIEDRTANKTYVYHSQIRYELDFLLTNLFYEVNKHLYDAWIEDAQPNSHFGISIDNINPWFLPPLLQTENKLVIPPTMVLKNYVLAHKHSYRVPLTDNESQEYSYHIEARQHKILSIFLRQLEDHYKRSIVLTMSVSKDGAVLYKRDSGYHYLGVEALDNIIRFTKATKCT